MAMVPGDGRAWVSLRPMLRNQGCRRWCSSSEGCSCQLLPRSLCMQRKLLNAIASVENCKSSVPGLAVWAGVC